MVKTSQINKAKLLQVLQNLQQNVPLSDYLFENLFLVADHAQETELAENTYLKVCHSKQTLHLIVFPTYKCNFRCPYCYESFPDIVMSKSTQDDVYSFVEEKLKGYSSLEIWWFGGEPLLEIDAIIYLSSKFQALCRKERKSYLANITTNGYFLTLDTFKELLKCNVRTYQITIDGLAPTHDRYRHLENGDSTYHTIIANLKAIRDNIKSAMFQVVIRTNMTKNLLNSINDHLTYINDEFLRDMRFKHVCRIAFSYNNEGIKDELLNNANLINSSFSNLRPNNSEVISLCSDCTIYPICLNVSCPYEHFSALNKKWKYCGSKIKDTLLYVQTLFYDNSMCINIDGYFAINNRETYLLRKEDNFYEIKEE